MTPSFRKALMAACILPLFASNAHAGLFDFDPAKGGAYITGFVGVAAPSDADFDGTQAPAEGVPGAAGASADIEADFDNDVYFGGGIGYKLPFKYWKYFQPSVELEVSYSEHDVSSGNFNGGQQVFSGEQSRTYFLLKNSSDIIWSENQRIVPYFGGGIGIGDFDTDIQYFPDNGTVTEPTFAVQGSDTAIATLSSIGARFKATDRFDVFVEGRYLQTWGNVDAERTFIAGGASGFNADVDDKPDGFTLAVGTRLNF